MNRRQARRLVAANLLTTLIVLCVCVATLILVIVFGGRPQ